MIPDVLSLGRRFNAAAGTTVYALGKPAKSLFYLSSGRFASRVASAKGREFIVTEVPPGQFTPISALLEGSKYVVDGVALSECEMIAFDSVSLRKLLLRNAEVADFFLQVALQRLERRTEQLTDVALLDAQERVAKRLLDIAHKQSARLHDGMTIRLRDPNHFIGLTIAGVSRETVSRQLRRLANKGMIRRSRRDITLLDIKQLRSLFEIDAAHD